MGFLHLPGLGKAHFHEYGTGQKPLLAFHGYGMTGKQFHVLDQSILPQYHIYGFDHFFHGESRLDGWTEQQIVAGMPKTMVRSYMEEWFKLYGRQRFSVMGYSIGANLALILVEEYADMIDDIILMAPDGLAVFKGFHFILHNKLGRAIFRTATKSKWLAPFLVKSMKTVGAIDESLYRIAYNEIDTEQKRLDTYYTLNLIRQLKPDVQKVAQLINQHTIKCLLIFGRHDQLFPKSAAMPFLGMLHNAEVHEVELGHWLVTKALDEYLVK
ncbi:alpha/beta fold hydrolase [Mucilaginibacter sp. 3215]|uniref:alpha/beta fold hydrolase n=1 Tax=Mucilaginibacter sp. 3215 TaxID=3373912 RepID=UPI003D1A04C9